MIGLTIWLPPLLWMAAIMWFSGGDFSAESTGSILRPLLHWVWRHADPGQIEALHGLARKAAHVTEYAVLATLWFVAFRHGRRSSRAAAAWAALLISAGWAVLDELHQSLEPSRTASAADVGLDAAGALLAVLVARAGVRRAMGAATTALLWIAAAGGAAGIAINLASGVPSGVLWITAPLALLLLVRRWRRGGARASPRRV